MTFVIFDKPLPISMKNLVKYFIVFALALLASYLFFNKKERNNEKEQIQVVLNEIKNVSKLVVMESSVTEHYNHEDTKVVYRFFNSEKKIFLLVNAKVQVAYDLQKMEVKTDSINKKIIIKNIPKPEINIIPEINYIDLQQGTFNTFTKEELNEINQKAIDKIKESSEINLIENKAEKQLLVELKKLYTITQILDWELIDETQEKLIINTFKD